MKSKLNKVLLMSLCLLATAPVAAESKAAKVSAGEENPQDTVTVNVSDKNKHQPMTESSVKLGEVVVTSFVGNQMVKQTSAPVSIIPARELETRPSTNLIDAISHLPGIAQVTTGSSISKPVIRGLGFNRVLVVSDGVRKEGQQWGDEHGVEID